MSTDEIVDWTFVFTFALFSVAIVLALTWLLGYRCGVAFGAAREEAKAWETLARAQRRVEAEIEARLRKMESGDEWPAEIDKE